MSPWEFWRRHKRKVYVSLGVVGTGYLLYRLYGTYRRRLSELERQLDVERETDELLKAKMQVHFENIQRIANSMTLPQSMKYLQDRVSMELDHLHLTERLMKGKGQPNTLTSAEKLELWERLKILSFTRMVLSIWAVTTISLYIRIQVNILGRHLYVDAARDFVPSQVEEVDPNESNSEQEFLESVDYLSKYGMPTLISNMQAAASEVLKGKQFKDLFNSTVLQDTVVQILDTFMRSPYHWVDHLMPEEARFYKSADSSSSTNPYPSNVTKFDKLMLETRAVLSSDEFRNVLEISLKKVVDALMEDLKVQCGESDLSAGIPLAKLLPQLTQINPRLLEETSRNRFTHTIQNIPEVEVFFTLLYANMPVP